MGLYLENCLWACIGVTVLCCVGVGDLLLKLVQVL